MSMSCSNRNCQKERKEIVEFLKEVKEKFERIERLFNETFAEIKKDASFIERILKQEEIFCDRDKSSDASISPPKRIKLSTTSANKDGCDSPLRRNIVTTETEIIMSPNKQTDVNTLPLLKGNSSNYEKDVSDHEHESNVSKCKKSCSSARRKRQAPSLRQSTALRGSHCSPIVVMSPDKQTDAKVAPILKGNSGNYEKDLSDRQHEDEKIERVSYLHRRTEDISSEPKESKCKKSYSPRKRKKQAPSLLQSTALHVSYCSPEQKSEDIIAFVQDEILKNNEIEIRAHVKYRNQERSAFKVTVPNGVSAEILKYQWPAPIKIQYWGKE